MFEKRVLRKVFGPEMDEVTGEYRELHNGKNHNLYCSPNVLWVIKQRTMRPDEQATLVEYRRGEVYTGFCLGNLRKRALGRPRHI